MKGNDTIIEVKPINAALNGIFKDLCTLTAFRRHAGYQKGIYLFYGYGDIDAVKERIRELQSRDREDRIDLKLIELWWHQDAGEDAARVDLNDA
jgi:hypothetical protein